MNPFDSILDAREVHPCSYLILRNQNGPESFHRFPGDVFARFQLSGEAVVEGRIYRWEKTLIVPLEDVGQAPKDVRSLL